MSTNHVSSAFDEIVASFDKKVPCHWVTKAGKECKRGANWDFDAHGCFGGPLCGHHYSQWRRMNYDRRYCKFCDTTFPSFTAAFTARKL